MTPRQLVVTVAWLGPLTSDDEPVWDRTIGQCVSLGLTEEMKPIVGKCRDPLAALNDPDPVMRRETRYLTSLIVEIMNAIRLGRTIKLSDHDRDWVQDGHPHLLAALLRQETLVS